MNPLTPQEQLLAHITQVRQAGKPDTETRAELLAVGWSVADVDAALSSQNVAGVSSATPQYAGFWHRLAASLLDSIILGLIFVPLIILGVTLATAAVLPSFVLDSLLFLLQLVVWFFYVVYAEAKKGQTLGKKFIGISVSNYEGGRISILRSLGRTFAKILSIIPFGIGVLMAAFTSKKQALHDMIAGTVVVKNERANKYKTMLVIILGIISPILFFIFAIPALMALIFGAFFFGTSDVQVLDESAVMPSAIEEPLHEEYDDYFSRANIWDMEIVTKEEMEEYGYTEAGPVVISWDQDGVQALSILMPAYDEAQPEQYGKIVFSEVSTAAGESLLDTNPDAMPFEMNFMVNGVRGGSVFLPVVSDSYVARVAGQVVFDIPLENGGVYHKSFDFTLER